MTSSTGTGTGNLFCFNGELQGIRAFDPLHLSFRHMRHNTAAAKQSTRKAATQSAQSNVVMSMAGSVLVRRRHDFPAANHAPNFVLHKPGGQDDNNYPTSAGCIILLAAAFSFSEIEPNRTGVITKWDVPLGRWCEMKFLHGQNHSIGMRVTRSERDIELDWRNEVARQAYFQAASHSPWSFKALAGTVSLAAGHLAHPIDFALFIGAILLMARHIRKRRLARQISA